MKRARILRVLDEGSIRIVYQPVADIRRGTVVGVEALARFADRTPDVWFNEAWSVGLGLELEIEAIRQALRCFDTLPAGVYVAVNAAPQTLLSDELFDLLSTMPGDRIVVELTEHAAVDDYPQMNAAVARLRALGVRLSIDDAGAGFSSFQHVLNLSPDTIKLDRSLTSNIEDNPVRAALAAALVTFAASLGANICAEGIETIAQLVSLQKLGIGYGQGYFLARPGTLPLPALPTGVWPSRGLARSGSMPSLPSPAIRSTTRLDALRDSSLLDSAQDEDFDRFTRLASRLLDVPIALVSLVDDRRQFFKSAVGLSPAVAALRETPLTHSLCQHAVTTRLPLVIDDAAQHPLVRDSGAVTELGVAAYLGVPLVTAEDEALGAFCAIAKTPRVWTEDDIDVMQSIASMVLDRIEHRAERKRRDEREALHRQVFVQSPEALFLGDVTGRIKLASERLCEVFACSASEILGRRIRSFVHPADLETAILLHRRLLVGDLGEAQAAIRFVRGDGSLFHGRMVWKVLRDSAGKVGLMSGAIERLRTSAVPTHVSHGPPDSRALS